MESTPAQCLLQFSVRGRSGTSVNLSWGQNHRVDDVNDAISALNVCGNHFCGAVQVNAVLNRNCDSGTIDRLGRLAVHRQHVSGQNFA